MKILYAGQLVVLGIVLVALGIWHNSFGYALAVGVSGIILALTVVLSGTAVQRYIDINRSAAK